MIRIVVFLVLAIIIFTPSAHCQEWLASYNRSVEFYQNDQLEEALAAGKSTLIDYTRDAELDHANYRVILRQLSVICYSLDLLDDGVSYAEQEVESWRKAAVVDELTYIDALENLGVIYSANGDFETSIEVLEEGLSLAKLNVNKTDPERAILEGHLAETCFTAGRLDESAGHFAAAMKVLDGEEELSGDYLNFCYTYGILCVEKEYYDVALKYLGILTEIYDAEESDPILISTHIGLGTSFTMTGDLKQGEIQFQKARNALSDNSNPQQLANVTKLLALNIEQQGRHEEAQSLLEGVGAAILNSGDKNEEQAYFLNSQATILLNNGKVIEALTMYDQALEILKELNLPHTESYATISLNSIKANAKAGNLNKASDLALEALAGQDSSNIIYYEVQAELGSILQKQGNFEQAKDNFDNIYSVSRAAWPNLQKTKILNKTASFYQLRGVYDRSSLLYQEALKLISPDDDKSLYQSVMFNYITLLQAQGELVQAESLLQELKSSIGTESPEIYLAILRNIGSLAQSKGDYAVAQVRYGEALALAKNISGEASALYADILLRIATLDKDLGNYQEAEPEFIKAGEIIASVQGRSHPNFASVDNNLGILYQQMGNYEKAEAKFKEAIEIYRATYGENHPDYVLSLENLATLYELLGEQDLALELLAQTLAANKVIYGETNANYAISLHNYASLLLKTERKDEAFKMLTEVLVLQERSAGKMQSSYANTLHNLAILAQEQGKFDLADSLIDEVLNIRANLFNTTHPSYTSALYSKAVLLQVTDRYAEAWPVYNEVMNQYLEQISKYFPSLSESEKNAFYAKMAPVINRYKEFCVEYYQFHDQSAEVLGNLYNAHLATKALLLNAVNKTRTTILNSGNQQLIDQFTNWTNLKKQLVNYYNFSKEQIAAEGINISALENEANDLEKSLSLSSELFAGQFDQTRKAWQDVADKLKPDEAAVELIRIDRNGDKDSVTYVALSLLHQSQTPKLSILPYGEKMEGKYFNYYSNTVKYKIQDQISYNVFWQPIDQDLGGIGTIYISADGVYNKININTLFNTKTEHYLIDDYFVKYISSTRDLLRIKTNIERTANPVILCLGDPAYDLNGIEGQPAILDDMQRSQFNMNQISALPGTKLEINYIDSLLEAHKWQVNAYTAQDAMEIKLKTDPAPTVLHLATHGFFMPDLRLQEIEDQFGKSEFDKNPLFRSGLLFAGASNKLEDAENDGLLTAYEAMNLYLDDTELVVLSACETALGDVKNGEGVYGLQRALQVAGAKKLVMSLWKVNDTATMELMRLFYEKWVNGSDIYSAMQQAQIEIKEKHNEPYYWGAFIMIGV